MEQSEEKTEEKNRFDRIREEERKVRSEVGKSMIGYLSAALGLVAGLAWNNAITAAIKAIFPSTGNGILAQFVYAIAITIAVAILVYYLTRIFSGKK
ncbi:MAG: hypothetical protein KGI49_03100 [Patescibacteria group bacterium]|nr:hypothetical protein [Patescibacteria group bacterium]